MLPSPALELSLSFLSGDFTGLHSSPGPLSASILWWLHSGAFHHWTSVPLCSLVASPRCLSTLTLATLLSGDLTALPSNAGPLSPSLSRETHVVLLFGASLGQQSSFSPYHGPPELLLSAQTWNSSPSPSNFSSITIGTRLNTLNSYCLPPLPLTCSSFFYVSHLFHLNWLPASSSACCSHARPLDASTKPAELGLSRTISSTEVSIRNVCLNLTVLSHIPDYPFKLTLSYFTHFFNIIILSLPTLLLWEHLHDRFLQAAHQLRQHPHHFGVLSHFCVVLLPGPYVLWLPLRMRRSGPVLGLPPGPQTFQLL